MHRSRFISCALFTASLACVLAGGCRKEASPPRVVINGRTWFVELATSPEVQYRGLAGREHLPDDAGMLFVFPDSSVRAFCMRGCLIPLDIAFIDAGGKVVGIQTMAVEEDLAGRIPYSSQVPIRYALEVAAGSLAAAGAEVGDEVTFLGDIPG